MDFFLYQLQYNIQIIIGNISKKYSIDKALLSEFYPEKIQTSLKKRIYNYLKPISNDLKKKLKNNNNLFMDEYGNKYIIVDSNTDIKYNSIYTAIKINV